MKISLRSWSLVFGVASLILPAAFFAYQQFVIFDLAEKERGFVCGLPILAAVLLSCLFAALFSAAAIVTGIIAIRRSAGPHSWGRIAELCALSLPFAGSLFVWLAVLWG